MASAPHGEEPLSEIVKQPFLDVAADIAGALVYLDDGAGEVAHLSLGASFLFGGCNAAPGRSPHSARAVLSAGSSRMPAPPEAIPTTWRRRDRAGLGAANVCRLDSASPEDAQLLQLSQGQPCQLLAIFLTRLLTDAHRSITRAIQVGGAAAHGALDQRRALPSPLTAAPRTPPPPARPQAHPGARRVLLYSAISEGDHASQASTQLGYEAYQDYRAHLLEDLAAAARQQQQAQQQQLAQQAQQQEQQGWRGRRSRQRLGSSDIMPAVSYQGRASWRGLGKGVPMCPHSEALPSRQRPQGDPSLLIHVMRLGGVRSCATAPATARVNIGTA